MNDTISRQAAIEVMGKAEWAKERLRELPSAQQETNAYSNMSDEEFEEWLYKHGICNPDIHESIPCSVVPLLIDNAISELPFAQTQRMKGRWIELTNTNHTYICSVCGRMLVNITDGKNNVAKNYPYCHCGADMRGE